MAISRSEVGDGSPLRGYVSGQIFQLLLSAFPNNPELCQLLSAKRPLNILSVPFSTTRANKGSIIMSTKNSNHDPLDLPPYQLRNLVRGIVWRDEHFDGMSIEDIAAREGLSKSGVRKIIMGSFDTLMAL